MNVANGGWGDSKLDHIGTWKDISFTLDIAQPMFLTVLQNVGSQIWIDLFVE